MPDTTSTFLINTANNQLHIKSVTRASLNPVLFTTINSVAGWTATDVSGTVQALDGNLYKTMVFKNSTANYTVNFNALTNTTAYILAIGGGGSGGTNGGGGGGAGQFIMKPVPITAGNNQSITIAVGTGGNQDASIDASNTQITGAITINALKGGRGQKFFTSPQTALIGSGGGGYYSNIQGAATTTGVTGCGNTAYSFGNDGGDAPNAPPYSGGGGGGAGQAGNNTTGSTGLDGTGGYGMQTGYGNSGKIPLYGIQEFGNFGSYYWGGGGGGASNSNNNTVGGGGNSGVASTTWSSFAISNFISSTPDGAVNTGSGGGCKSGGTNTTGSGIGGSGIVIMAFPVTTQTTSPLTGNIAIPSTVFLNGAPSLYYPFQTDMNNYASNTTIGITDASGPTVISSSQFYKSGVANSLYISTNAAQNYLRIPNIPFTAAGFTVSLWARLNATGTNQLFNFEYGTPKTYASLQTIGLKWDSTTSGTFTCYAGSKSGTITSMSQAATTWTHIVYTYASTGTMTVYVNGGTTNYNVTTNPNGKNGSTTVVNDLTASFPSDSFIGSSYSKRVFTTGFAGYINNFYYFPRVLNQSEITALWQQ